MHVETATTRIARVARTGRRAGPGLALACTLAISACGSNSSTSSTAAKSNVDTAKVEQAIKQSILAQRHLSASVVCPSPQLAIAGRTFECFAITQSVKKPFKPVRTPFLVTVQNNRGGVTYVGK
jgi:hypothetical protein